MKRLEGARGPEKTTRRKNEEARKTNDRTSSAAAPSEKEAATDVNRIVQPRGRTIPVPLVEEGRREESFLPEGLASQALSSTFKAKWQQEGKDRRK